jgi:hypothetical protein
MQFSGEQLSAILTQQNAEVAIYDGQGFFRGNVRASAAVRMIGEREFVGIGNKRRIRYLRPLWAASHLSDLNHASRTTCRIRNDGGVIIAPRPYVEHKPLTHDSLTK